MKDSVKLQFIPKNLELKGLMFSQKDFCEGIQSAGKVEGAAYAIGRAHTGEEVKVYLDIADKHIEANKKDSTKTYPKIGKGSKDKPFVAVMEQVEKVGDKEYVAKWRSSLQDKKSSLAPLWGVGRVEIDHGTPEYYPDAVKELMLRKTELKIEHETSENPLEIEAQIEQLDEEIVQAHSKTKIRAVYALHHEMYENVEPSIPVIEEIMREVYEKYPVDGFKAGVIIRVRRGDQIIAALCSEYRRTEIWDKDSNKMLNLEDIDSAIAAFKQYGGEYLVNTVSKNEGMVIDIIPEVIITGGPMIKYAKDPVEYRKIRHTYYEFDDSERAIARFMAVRLNENIERDEDEEQEGNYLLSMVHAISGAIGHFLELDKDYVKKYKINYAKLDFKRAQEFRAKKFLALGTSPKVENKVKEVA